MEKMQEKEELIKEISEAIQQVAQDKQALKMEVLDCI
jgi:phenylpyruvate tautomerase PptA (4-oxalocrotonate tautomerase family)